MKIRVGFVSNSSTSSFICMFCGNQFADRDLSKREVGLVKCEHGHLFDEEEILGSYSLSSIKPFSAKALKECVERKMSVASEYSKGEFQDLLEIINDFLEGKHEDSETPADTFENRIYDDEWDDFINEEVGIPELFCPVCNRLKEMQKDPEYEKYKELFEHFHHIRPDGVTTEINYENY